MEDLERITRKCGVLMPMSSLPSPYGIGTMGKSAYRFVDFLKAAGQSYWQLLPLGPTSYGDSPYASFSTFAGNPYYIDLDLLVKDGLLRHEEITSRDWGENAERVDYGKIYENRFAVLRMAFRRGAEKLAEEMAAFRAENAAWVEDYALWVRLYGAGFTGRNLHRTLYYAREDRDAHQRRRLRYRINEARVRCLAVQTLGLPKWGYVSAARPLLVGLLPGPLYRLLHRKRLGAVRRRKGE